MSLFGNKLSLYYIKKNSQAIIIKFFRFLLLSGICFIIVQPLIIKFSAAFMSKEDLYDQTVLWIPKNPTLFNFEVFLKKIDYFPVLLTTFALCCGVTFLTVCSCSLSAYGLARFRFKGSRLLMFMVVLSLLVPPQTYSTMLYMDFRYFDFGGILQLFGEKSISLLNTPLPFILLSITGTGIRNGLYILILRQMFSNLPKEIEEAATVDGAGFFKTFISVMLPNAIPGIVTCALISFVWQWNDTFYSDLLIPDWDLLISQIGKITEISKLSVGGLVENEWMLVSLVSNAGILLVIIPLIILYLFSQRYFVEGVERTGIVG